MDLRVFNGVSVIVSRSLRCLSVPVNHAVTPAALLGLSLALTGPSVSAQPGNIPRAATWITDGDVYDIAQTTDTVYIGGQFSYVGPNTGCGAPLDTTTRQAVPAFPKLNGYVYTSASDGSGGWYVGGNFTKADSFTRNYIVHIKADGTVDPTWNPNANGAVVALVVSGPMVYVGGQFTNIGGQTRSNVAALDTSTGGATEWAPNPNGAVRAIAVSGSTIYVGGDFGNISGLARPYLAAIDAASTGAATEWNPNSSGVVRAIAASDTTVYVGGDFTAIGGQSRNRIAALDANSTGVATAWSPNANGPVYALARSGSTVYAGGTFSSIGGQPRSCIAALDSSAGAATAWDPNAAGSRAGRAVNALAVSGPVVYAGGLFVSIGGKERRNIAALDAASTGTATDWDLNASDLVGTMAASGSTVFAGGMFKSVGGRVRNSIAALDAATGSATAWNPNATLEVEGHLGRVSALGVSGSTVYAGGEFSSIGGQTRSCIAALDATTGKASEWNPDAYGYVNALVISGPTVYIAGSFTSVGGQPRNGIAAIDIASTGVVTAWDPKPNNSVRALAALGSTVYASGDFRSIGGQTRNGIAALDMLSTGTATNWDPNPNQSVTALAVSGSTVYVGGLFSRIGGPTRNCVAALDALSTGSATAWNPNANGQVSALAVCGQTVYVGGQFSRIGGQTRNGVAALDSATGKATAWNPNTGNTLAVAASGSTAYVGGLFTTVGGNSQPYFAQFCTPPVSVLEPEDPTRASALLKLGFHATGAGDGVAATHLWAKIPGATALADTGISQPGLSGAFTYPVSAGNGMYEFATTATDNSGNAEANPKTAGTSILVNTVPNGPFEQAYPTGAGAQVFPMTDDLDVTVTLTGGSPGAAVTVSRVTPTTATAPVYFQHPDSLLNESLEISGQGLGTGFSADIDWAFDAANVAGGGVDTVWRFGAGSAPEAAFSVTPSGGVITVTGTNSFSTWYAGNSAAAPVAVSGFAVE